MLERIWVDDDESAYWNEENGVEKNSNQQEQPKGTEVNTEGNEENCGEFPSSE